MSALLEKQFLFSRLKHEFETMLFDNDYTWTQGEAYRTQAQAILYGMTAREILSLCFILKTNGYEELSTAIAQLKDVAGSKKSLHMLRLAADYNFFKDGVLLNEPDDFKEIGEIAVSLGLSYGGEWGDYGHISLEHDGMR